MDAEPPARAPRRRPLRGIEPLKRDGVVEVARVGGVDGEHVSVADIAIARRQSADLVENARARLVERRLAERRLELMTRHDGIDAEVRGIGGAKHLLHDAGRRRATRGKRADAHADEGAVLDVGIVGPTREDVVGYARVGGNHHAERLRHLVAADHDVMSAIENAHDARDGQALPLVGRRRGLAGAASAFRALARAASPLRGKLDEIPVERAVEHLLRDEVLALGGLHESEPTRAHHENPVRVGARRAPGMRTRTAQCDPPDTYEWESERAVSCAMSIWVSTSSSPFEMDTSGTTPMPSMSWPKGLR